MKLYHRLKYLVEEGFQVVAVSGLESQRTVFNVTVDYLSCESPETTRRYTEYFRVDSRESAACKALSHKIGITKLD